MTDRHSHSSHLATYEAVQQSATRIRNFMPAGAAPKSRWCSDRDWAVMPIR